MYDEFPTAYETSLGLKWIYLIIFGVIGIIIIAISLISLAKIFKKANRSTLSAFIPFYNLIILLEITNSPRWYFFLFLIPGVNVAFYVIIMFSLANSFRKNKNFALGLIFLPFIFYPILGFSNSEYIGINLEAINGGNANVEIPKIVDADEVEGPVIHEDKDDSLKNINISIGGGVYQKDYTNTLLQVDEKQTVFDKMDITNEQESLSNEISDNGVPSSKLSFINPVEEHKNTLTEKKLDSIIQFPEPIDFIKESNHTSIDFKTETENTSINNMPTSFSEQNNTTTQNNFKEDQYSLEQPTFSSSIENSLDERLEFPICSKCGARVKKDAKICFLCGNKLD